MYKCFSFCLSSWPPPSPPLPSLLFLLLITSWRPIPLCRVLMRGYKCRCSSLCRSQRFLPLAFGLPRLSVEESTCGDKEQRKPLQACAVASPLPALLHRDIHGMDSSYSLLWLEKMRIVFLSTTADFFFNLKKRYINSLRSQ